MDHQHGLNVRAYPPSTLTGFGLARNGRTASQKAALAASIINGEVTFAKPTKGQIAKLVGVSVPYIDKALKLTPQQREAMRVGNLELQSFQKAPTDLELSRVITAAGPHKAWEVIEGLI